MAALVSEEVLLEPVKLPAATTLKSLPALLVAMVLRTTTSVSCAQTPFPGEPWIQSTEQFSTMRVSPASSPTMPPWLPSQTMVLRTVTLLPTLPDRRIASLVPATAKSWSRRFCSSTLLAPGPMTLISDSVEPFRKL